MEFFMSCPNRKIGEEFVGVEGLVAIKPESFFATK
jgi:hypothetical protein